MNSVELRNVKKVFGLGNNAVWAVNGITLEIPKGEFIALVGASGSGKSTLLNLLGGLEYPTSGEILVEGIDICKLKKRDIPQFRRRNIGFVFQNYSLLPMLNIYDNIILPLSFEKRIRADHKEHVELLQYLGIWEQRQKFPHELSGGQQQRVAIARALINKPAILLADEPTGNLDSKTTNSVMEVLQSSCQKYKQTILMVTHNLEIAQMCNKVIHIEDGKIKER